MLVGCVKEIKPQEFRVGMTPAAVREVVGHGHQVVVEAGAGVGAGFADVDYGAAGARIHLSASGARSGADGGPHGLGRDLHCL